MIKISSLKKARREGKTDFTYEQDGEIKTEEIPISFLKPTEELWNDLVAMESGVKEDEQSQKGLFVRRLVRVELQSAAITDDEGRPYSITEQDLKTLEYSQILQLWAGVKDHFFLQTLQPKPETDTKSISAQASTVA